MKIHRALLTPVVVSLMVLGGLAWWGGPSPAGAALVWNTAQVSIAGTVAGQPESVAFSGRAKIQSRLSRDEVNLTRTPSLVLYIDLSSVSGVGSSTRTKYVISGPEIAQRPLAASDVIEVAFPFFQSGTAGISSARTAVTARTGVASFALSFDLTTGAVTSAKASISSPNFSR